MYKCDRGNNRNKNQNIKKRRYDGGMNKVRTKKKKIRRRNEQSANKKRIKREDTYKC